MFDCLIVGDEFAYINPEYSLSSSIANDVEGWSVLVNSFRFTAYKTKDVFRTGWCLRNHLVCDIGFNEAGNMFTNPSSDPFMAFSTDGMFSQDKTDHFLQLLMIHENMTIDEAIETLINKFTIGICTIPWIKVPTTEHLSYTLLKLMPKRVRVANKVEDIYVELHEQFKDVVLEPFIPTCGTV